MRNSKADVFTPQERDFSLRKNSGGDVEDEIWMPSFLGLCARGGWFYSPKMCNLQGAPWGEVIVWQPFQALLTVGSGGLLLEDCKAK